MVRYAGYLAMEPAVNIPAICGIGSKHGLMASSTFPKRTKGIAAFGAVTAQPSMPKECELGLTDSFPGQYPGKYQVQHRDFMVEGACGDPEKWNVPEVGHHEHGSGKHRRTVVAFWRPPAECRGGLRRRGRRSCLP